MTIKEIDSICIDKINCLYEDLILLYQNHLIKLGFKVGDYIFKYKDGDNILSEKKHYPYLITEILIENNNDSDFFRLPKIIVKTNKCFKDKTLTKSFYRLENIEDFKLFTDKTNKKTKNKILKQTYIYLIEAGDIYKIGFSNNPSSRLKSIQTHNPYKCKIIYKIKDPFGTLEKDLHVKFNSLRINGEWFKKSELIIKEFELLINNEHQLLEKPFTLFPISA
jgi:hypothetical protein